MRESKKKNVLIIVHHLKIGGGAEKIASEVADNLDSSKFNVKVLTFYDFTPKYRNFKQEICLNEKLTTDPFTKFYKILKRARIISNICKQKKIDVVISFLHDANFSNILSKVLFKNKAKIIVSERNNTLKQTKLFQYLVKQLYPKADLVVALSKGVENSLNKNFGVKKTKTIYNMQNVNKFLELGKENIKNKNHIKIFEKSFVFITIGRLSKQKAQWNLIRSFKRISDENEKAKLIILGNGELKDKLEELIKKLNLEKKVFLLGVVDNVFPYLKKSDCFVLTSDYEGFGNVITEALSQNTPIISTDCKSGPREILCPELKIDEKIKYPYNGKYGVLVETFQDSNNFNTFKEKPLSKQENILANTMIEVTKNKDLKRTYSKGLKRAKDFDKKNIIKEWEKIIIQGNKND